MNTINKVKKIGEGQKGFWRIVFEDGAICLRPKWMDMRDLTDDPDILSQRVPRETGLLFRIGKPTPYVRGQAEMGLLGLVAACGIMVAILAGTCELASEALDWANEARMENSCADLNSRYLEFKQYGAQCPTLSGEPLADVDKVQSAMLGVSQLEPVPTAGLAFQGDRFILARDMTNSASAEEPQP